MTGIDSKAIGEAVEELVVDAIDALEAVDEDDHWHDAVATESIAASGIEGEAGGVPVTFVGVDEPLEAGTPIEIKAARDRISDGTGSRRGRLQLRRGQHSTIRAERGAYLAAVYYVDGLEEAEEVDDLDLELLELLVLAADVVDDVLGAWIEVRRREPYAQISWGSLPFTEGDRRAALLERTAPLRRADRVPSDLSPRAIEVEPTQNLTQTHENQ